MDWYDLPEVALIRVLNCLSVHDQLNARLVCRHWKQIRDSSVRRDELILFLEVLPSPICWYHNAEEADLSNAFLMTKFEVLKNEFFFRHFRKMRRLMIVQVVNKIPKEFIEQIQATFRQLEHLQLSSLCGKGHFSGRELEYETNFQLPNLRTFYMQANNMKLNLDCPKLTELFVYSTLAINGTTDEKTKLCIQNLRLLLVRKLTYPPGFEFSNLEILYFNQPSPSIFLRDFPRLKELHYFEGTGIIHRELQNHMENLLDQKRRLKRDQLRVYFDGFELNDQTGFESLKPYLSSLHLEDLCGLDLNVHMLRHVYGGPLDCKFDLLCTKTLVMSDQLDDELINLPENDHLVESMLKSVKCIRFGNFRWMEPLSKESLIFFKLSDRFRYVCQVHVAIEQSQALLDQLPGALPHVVDFYYGPAYFRRHFANFEFVGQFQSLHGLHIDRRLLSIGELRRIMENCKFIDFLCFQRRNVRIEFHRTPGQKVFQAHWRSPNFNREHNEVPFARATFTREELVDYLEAGKLVEKNDFLCQTREEIYAYDRTEYTPFNAAHRFAFE